VIFALLILLRQSVAVVVHSMVDVMVDRTSGSLSASLFAGRELLMFMRQSISTETRE